MKIKKINKIISNGSDAIAGGVILKTANIECTSNYMYDFDDSWNIVYAAANINEVTSSFNRYGYTISNNSRQIGCFYLNSTVSDTRVYLSSKWKAVILYS